MKIRIRRRIIIGLVILVAAVSLYAVPRAITTVRFAGQAHVPSLDGKFEDFSSLLPSTLTPTPSLHLGLPHNYFEEEEFIRAVWLSRTTTFYGYRFRSGPWKPSDSFASVVQAVLTTPDSFRPYVGPKLCGGFHADFMTRFKMEGAHIDMMVCLGCREVLVFAPGDRRILELNGESTGRSMPRGNWNFPAMNQIQP